ncbi:alkane hydroxylase MAH1-like [Salvia hispanica]|uniref:alkane hydroxylase MAH1-like n=1 Tax=Salvia hispanica TaxID=49212 RepID=UPI0020091C2E|nr:alkane hydroxylase MAH1-like [Salvia hispanica]
MGILDYYNYQYCIFLFLLLLLVHHFRLADRRGKKPCEPTNYPVIGMLPDVILNLHRAHDYLNQILNDCGGTYLFRGPWLSNMDMLFTSDPANIHHVFSRNFSNYPKGPEFRIIFDILGDGIFSADFELWEIHRKTTLALLTHADFNARLERTVWGKVETGLFPVLDHFCSGIGMDLDLQDVFQRFTFDNICKLVLDHDPCSLSLDMPYLPCEKAFSHVAEPLLRRHVTPRGVWKLLRLLKVGSERKLLECSKAFTEFIYPHIRGGGGGSMLRAFERVYREKKIGSTDGLRDFLKDTSLNLMFAGRDTTSTCLTWLFWLVAQNPASERKILEEIEHEFGKRNWRCFTAQDSQKLVYLHGALCESLRLFPPVALEHKAPVRPDVLPSGHPLGRNGKLIISFYSVGRMESVWGKDCLEFKPERWITSKGGLRHEASYKFPAFNAGPRMCLGKEMAFIQMKMVAAAIMRRYHVRLVEGHPVCPRESIILQAKHGLKVNLSKRN